MFIWKSACETTPPLTLLPTPLVPPSHPLFSPLPSPNCQIACNGNRWRIHTNHAEAKAHIHASFDRLHAATGRADVPTGWFAGGQLVHTKLARAEVHRERSVPLRYCSDVLASDVPYWVRDPYAAVHGGPDQGLLMVPYSLCTNDHRFFVIAGAGGSAPDDWIDLLCAEGRAGAPKMMTIAMRNRFVAKPGRIMALKRLMAHVAATPDVWFCPRQQIAAHWREHYPYEKVGPISQQHPTDV